MIATTESQQFASPFVRVALAAFLVLAIAGCSDDPAQPDASRTTEASALPATVDSTSMPADTSDGLAGKALVADGSHWGCPGTYCGPSVSRFTSTKFDAADAIKVERGTRFTAECHTTGEAITDPVTGASTAEWVRLAGVADEHIWMSAHYFGTVDFASVIDGLTACE